MYIQEITVRNFRNYETCSLQFDSHLQVFIGENAQGKTNLLEAIYVLAFAKSHRTSNEKELIQWTKEYGKISGEIVRNNTINTHELIVSKKGKKARINAVEKAKLSQYIGKFNVVMFAPEDLSLVKGSPQIRRKFLDMELGQISSTYLSHLSLFQKILQQRNALLKKMGMKHQQDETLLDVLTEQFIKQSAIVVQKRSQFLHLVEKWAQITHSNITQNKEKLTLKYIPSVEVSEFSNVSKIEEAYMKYFNKIREKEIFRGVSLFGPHRDDFSIYVNEIDVQTYGSQGQQRTASLSLKLAELELIRDEVGEYPVLLLDDVLSELDNSRQTHLLDTIEGKIQTFVTTTNIDGIDHKTVKKASIFRITEANIEKQQ